MKLALMIMCMLVTLAPQVHAQDRGFGLGLILGEPTGLSAKTWVSSANAVDFGLAWSFRRSGYLHIHADYLWHFRGSIESRERFVPYVGLGGRLGGGDNRGVLGLRISGGIAWWPRSAPIDVFLEIAPILDLVPATEMSMNGGVGARFYFD